MPSEIIPAFGDDVAVKIQVRVAELEASGATNIKIDKVEDQYMLTYTPKSRVGRPPKMETR